MDDSDSTPMSSSKKVQWEDRKPHKKTSKKSHHSESSRSSRSSNDDLDKRKKIMHKIEDHYEDMLHRGHKDHPHKTKVYHPPTITYEIKHKHKSP